MNRLILPWITLVLMLVSPLRAGTFQWEPPLPSGRVAAFKLWTPDDAPRLEAVIAVIPGFMGDSRASADDADWQRLAARWHCALLGCKLQNDGYWVASGWSGPTLLLALGEFARQTHHPELANARLAFWGHSAGGQFSAAFVFWRPDRVIAFVANRGSFEGNPNFATHRIPALWITGEKDKEQTTADVIDIFSSGRRQGAPWAYALEPGVGHEVVGSKPLGIAFIDAIFRTGTPEPDFRAQHPAFPKPWTGDLRTHEIRAADTATPGQRLNSWLPDEGFAKEWSTFVQPHAETGTPAKQP